MTVAAIVLNDCSRPWHWGTRLVMEGLQAEAARAGIAIAHRYPRGFARWDAEFDARVDASDIVLINGEGTCHHDAPHARLLFDAAERAKRRGKPVVLLNTIWEDNPRLDGRLGQIDLVFVRESRSANQVRRAGQQVDVVPDLSLGAELQAPGQGPARHTVVTDSVVDAIALDLADQAVRHRLPLHPMRRWTGLLARHPVRAGRALPTGVLRPLGPEHLPLLSTARLIVSGRFHGACLALLLRVPLRVVSSNSHKIEGLAVDAGLYDVVVAANRIPDLFQTIGSGALLGDTSAFRQRASAYVALARERHVEMFQRIATLARSSRTPARC
jgi:hypothetical protein